MMDEMTDARLKRDLIHVEIADLQRRASKLGLRRTAERLARAMRARYEPPDLSPPPDPATVKLTDPERRVLLWIVQQNPDWGFPFKRIAQGTGLPAHQVKRPVRALARKGVLRLERLFSEDDGLLVGSGFMLTEAGRARGLKESEG